MNSVPSCKFHHSQWEECRDGEEHSSLAYLVYRIVFMIILVSSMTFSTLCQSYLFEIFLTNWSFTLQTLYAVLSSFNIVWKMRGSLMQTVCIKFYHVYPESNAKSYELKEANSSWDNIATTDTNSMIVENDDKRKNDSSINIETNTREDQQQLNSTTTSVLTTDSCALASKSDTSVIISNNNNTKNNSSNDNAPSVLEKMIWALMNVSHVLPHIVAFGYWLFVYKYVFTFHCVLFKNDLFVALDPDQKTCERFRSHFIVHGATSFLAFVDSLIVAVPVRKSHFVFPSFVLLVYGLFCFIYEAAGGPYRNGKEFIYSILNWCHKPGKTIIIVIVGFILSPIMHLVSCWGVHHVKVWIVSWYVRRKGKK